MTNRNTESLIGLRMEKPSLRVVTGVTWTFAVLSNAGVSRGKYIPILVWLMCQVLGLYWYGTQGLWIYLSALVALIMPAALVWLAMACLIAGDKCVPL